MPGLKVKDAIAIGQSQSAGRLAVYYNTVQPLHDVFDGFALWDRSGQLRSDLTVPASGVASDGLGGSFVGARWTTSEYQRKWEIADATDAQHYGPAYTAALRQRHHTVQPPNPQPTTLFTRDQHP